MRVRRERWQVAATADAGGCRLLTLIGLGPDNLLDQRMLLAPFEVIERIKPPTPTWRSGRRRWRRACRTLLANSGGWSSLRSADAAALDVLPHQLEPALAVLRGEGCRVLLADEVGLGKTIEAGLLVTELLRRGFAQRVLFLTPAGLRDQWAMELHARFGHAPVVMDARNTAVVGATLPPGENPWAAVPLAIASIDYVKRPEVLPFIRSRPWDIVVVDEAHAVTPDSDRHAAVAELCESAVFVILLTATPHNGDRRSFDALCALGDQAREEPALIFRRSRTDVGVGTLRHVHRMTIEPSAPEWRMLDSLDCYAAAVRQESTEDEPGSVLLLTTLRKRALSSPESLRVSVERRLAILAQPPVVDSTQLWLPLDEAGGEDDSRDVPPTLLRPLLADRDQERRLLRAVLNAAAAARMGETKLAALGRLLRRLHRRGEPAIVFTEYRDTLEHIQQTLGLDAAVLHGGLARDERRRVVESFIGGTSTLLLATDAGGEGLNLHQRCRVVVHLELPWNPARLEQRMGRVDRIGQRRPVHAFYLIARHSAEDRMLDRLRSRVERARLDIGAADPLSSAPDTDAGLVLDDEQRLGRRQRAEAEARRIGQARRIRTRRVDAVNGRGVRLVMKARCRLREELRGQWLLLLGLGFDDGAGRALAVQVDGLLIDPARLGSNANDASWRSVPAPWLAASGVLARIADEALRRRVHDSSVLAEHARFSASVLARARRIEQAARAQAQVFFQPGLFDNRATRLQHVLSIEQQGLVEAAAFRVSRLTAMASAPDASVHIQLLIVP